MAVLGHYEEMAAVSDSYCLVVSGDGFHEPDLATQRGEDGSPWPLGRARPPRLLTAT
jgi:hypothetical protein